MLFVCFLCQICHCATRRIVVTFNNPESARALAFQLEACGKLVRQYGRRAIIDVRHDVVDIQKERQCVLHTIPSENVIENVEEDHMIRSSSVNTRRF